MIKLIKQKLQNMIKSAILKSIEDADFHQFATVDCLGTERKASAYSPYGLYSNPEDGSLCILLSQNGNEDSLYSLIWHPKNRLKLKKGEVALWNKKKSTGIKLLDDKIRIEGFNATIDIEPGGKITVNATEIKIDGSSPTIIDGIDIPNHVHVAGTLLDGNEIPVTGLTGAPVPVPPI